MPPTTQFSQMNFGKLGNQYYSHGGDSQNHAPKGYFFQDFKVAGDMDVVKVENELNVNYMESQDTLSQLASLGLTKTMSPRQVGTRNRLPSIPPQHMNNISFPSILRPYDPQSMLASTTPSITLVPQAF